MEALSVAQLPRGPEWRYEPKWDGFRCLAFKDGDSVELRSKSGQPLGRYFPEVVDAVRAVPARRFLLDGELVVPVGRSTDFDALLMRIHPAESRVRRLAQETPARFVVFDLLEDEAGTSLLQRPLAERRPALERLFASALEPTPLFTLSPATSSFAEAARWLQGKSGTDGVIAKRADQPYLAGERGMQKVKRKKTADCVVGGFRFASKGGVVGSLLLGLYDDAGLLHHVGFISSLSEAERKALTPKLQAMRGTGFTGNAPGGPSRWSTRRSDDWVPLEHALVVEVEFDHVSNGRFRHGTKLLRWRPEKAPRQCTLEQLAATKA